MKLKEILTGINDLKAKGNLDIDVNKITSDSRSVESGDMFVAIKGFDVDGHKFVKSAIDNGAKVVLINEDMAKDMLQYITPNVTLITAKDTREALAVTASNFYGNPSSKFKLIGVTGTKGKTTTTFMIKEILEKAKDHIKCIFV